MKVAVIGGGIAGLTAAYKLAKFGADVTLFEKSGVLGGQAASFDFGGIPIEVFYHFICGADHDLFDLLEELDIKERLRWEETKTAFFYEGIVYPFCNPLDLLKFSPITLRSRLAYGLHISSAKYTKKWEKYDRVSAVSWLIDCVGEEAYRVLWHPLLKIKFGSRYDKVSAAWLWHRIHRVASSRRSLFSKEYMGYLEGGSQTLIDALARRIRELSGKLRLRSKVERIVFDRGRVKGLRLDGRDCCYDAVVCTAPLPSLAPLLPPEAASLKEKIGRIDFIGVVCMLLKLRRPLTDNFWLNINDPRISFNGIIEYTNLNRSLSFQGVSLAYIPFYLPVTEERFACPDRELFEEYCGALTLVNPCFEPDWVLDYRVFRHKYAQPVCTTGFLDKVLSRGTEFPHLFLTDTSQLYPMDRCLSGMVGLADKLSVEIEQRLSA